MFNTFSGCRGTNEMDSKQEFNPTLARLEAEAEYWKKDAENKAWKMKLGGADARYQMVYH